MTDMAFAPSANSPVPATLSFEVSDVFAPHIYQISGWPGSKKLGTALKKTCGAAPDIGIVFEKNETYVLGISHATWLVISANNDIEQKLLSIDRNEAAVTDNSGGRVVFKISGAHAAIKLSKGANIDFSVANFAVGTCIQTAIHHMGALIVRTAEDTFLVSTMRSFGEDMKAWLKG